MKNYLGIACLMVLAACQSSEKKSTEKADTTVVAQADTTLAKPGFTDAKVEAIYVDYLQLKDALVNTSFDSAKATAKVLETSLMNYKGCENTAALAKKIAEAKDIASQRKDFTMLSNDVIALFKNASLTTGTIYVQRCPMANEGDGGEWLASEKNIRNPYYGSEMMECGAVLSEIKAK